MTHERYSAWIIAIVTTLRFAIIIDIPSSIIVHIEALHRHLGVHIHVSQARALRSRTHISGLITVLHNARGEILPTTKHYYWYHCWLSKEKPMQKIVNSSEWWWWWWQDSSKMMCLMSRACWVSLCKSFTRPPVCSFLLSSQLFCLTSSVCSFRQSVSWVGTRGCSRDGPVIFSNARPEYPYYDHRCESE